MKNVCGVKLMATVEAKRKGCGESRETEFELGIGFVVDHQGKPTGEIRIQAEHVDTGIPPVSYNLTVENAQTLILGFDDAILYAKRSRHQ